MDSKIKKCCPNCSQPYVLKSISQHKTDLWQKQSNLPLFLSCGHTMCQCCISQILKFEEPIECKICHRDMQLTPSELAMVNLKRANFYKTFPVNFSMLGELTFQLIEQSSDGHDKQENEYVFPGPCMECHIMTTKMCQECTTILCDACFNKSHKNFVIFKNHVLKNIEPVTVPNKCKLHKGKSLDYYCEDCHKSICMDCLMVGGDKSCKNHNVVSMQEVNDNFLEDVIDITPKVDETYRRLTKTAVDVGHLLHNIENETGTSSELTQMLDIVKQHFSKLTAAVQKHEQEVLDIIVKLKCSEKESLRKAKTDLTESIKKAKIVLNAICAASDKNKAKQVNLSVLLDEAKQIVDTPWFLCRDQTNDPLKVAVNEDLCSLVSDYIHLEGNANSVYLLRAGKDLGEGEELPPPPPAPVFPPELPKDVRQMGTSEKGSVKSQPGFIRHVPKYHSRSKSGSVTSLNSQTSDHSDKSGE
ncbi:b-box zinc finger domain-containing protein [Phthorimaea operculella]|nr:b-box zinc finger domain-containing protein [Phthorimaea operculella]